MTERDLVIGVDIGGTFTDVVAVSDGDLFTAKVPSTPGQLVEGVATGVARVLAECDREPGQIRRFIHGTTVATNALLTGDGAKIGVLTTEGFEDTLEIGRQIRSREALYALDAPPQTPVFLARRRVRRGVPERIDAHGEVVRPLDEEALLASVNDLVGEHEVEALAVCFLFSFLNPGHELRAREVIAEHHPDIEVSLSCEVDPVIREYERLCMTCTDAYVRPVVRGYIQRLEAGLAAMGVRPKLQIMQSRGAIAGASSALRSPVTLVASGPAAGVQGGIDAALRCGFENAVTIDIGGTSSDVALVQNGRALVGHHGIVRGFPLRMAMVDVDSIGAGGGSIAWIDSGDGLRVGPRSAGASPGPVCYGRGGVEPTVTDASVVLGYLNPHNFAAGDIELDADAALNAITALGERLRLDPIETALGIHRVVNAAMANQIRLRSVGRGEDPRGLALVVLGGAGPLHGAALSDELGIDAIVVPSTPGVLAAYGLLVSSIEHERAATFLTSTTDADGDELEARLDALREHAQRLMDEEEVADSDVVHSRSADLRYVGQSYELTVQLVDPGDPRLIEAATEAFYLEHERVYGHMSREAPVEFVNLRVTLTQEVDGGEAVRAPEPDSSEGRRDQRTMYFPNDRAGVLGQVVPRASLAPGAVVAGPAVIEQRDSTTALPAGWRATVQPAGEILMERQR